MAANDDVEYKSERRSGGHIDEDDARWLQMDVYQKPETPKDAEDVGPAPPVTFDGVEDDIPAPPAAPAAQPGTFLGMPSSTWATSLGLAVAILLIGLDATIVSVATPQITDDLGGLDDVGWFGSV
ncbi:hypothetical protein KVR01_008903 [Diaporthe batatas]|uniref:uncharacterized protein n=1 Tax=Diaporthe batatas TaxID=748121 RepID=UPI001D04B361|nr:uncharacterized protein KVR01_008903 [Diaporthe batatas]KAG8160639.1 hypothetical protein KVR01_008903 [Diaporthe batatas]